MYRGLAKMMSNDCECVCGGEREREVNKKVGDRGDFISSSLADREKRGRNLTNNFQSRKHIYNAY